MKKVNFNFKLQHIPLSVARATIIYHMDVVVLVDVDIGNRFECTLSKYGGNGRTETIFSSWKDFTAHAGLFVGVKILFFVDPYLGCVFVEVFKFSAI